MIRGGLVRLLAPLPRLSLTPHLSPRHLSTSSSLLQASLPPAFSTTGDTKSLVTKLSLNNLVNVLSYGAANTPLPKDYQVDLPEFLAGAEAAAAVVTRAAAAGEWGELEGLVEDSCLRRLTSAMEAMTEEQRSLVTLNPDDVLFSFIANEKDCEGGTDMRVVTFSFPGLGAIRAVQRRVAEQVAEAKAAGELTPARFAEITKANMEETGTDPAKVFQSNELVIGNYRLARGGEGGWLVREVGQMGMAEAMAPLGPLGAYFRFRWRGRLGIHIKLDKPFLSVLRLDYATDWLALFAIYMTLLPSALGVTGTGL